jgi:2-polyprenyl-6-methoxyphenol hydroxylase-like FAD-dependent oxidoreductase/predicted DsbA family dithiol-disulfide isomerase
MKVVIIGSGIAGMALAVILRNNGFEISINERDSEMPRKGHAFLMHPDAMDILNDISAFNPGIEIPGQVIDKIVLKRPDNAIIQSTELESWICMKRIDIIKYLNDFISESEIHYNRTFSHFIYENEKAIAAAFANGDVEYGDIFIGCDGANSRVRQSLFGDINFTPVQVKEIVGVVHNPNLIARLPSTFTKYICNKNGLAIGLIPCSNEEMVWFMQFDVNLQKNKDESPENLRSLCYELLNHFPEEVFEILSKNNFNNNYVWHSTDFDLLPAFHKSNVALIGDAAHVALPFTSAGTTNALLDASKMAELLINNKSTFEETCHKFYEARATQLKEHINLGREIKDNFLNASDAKVTLPLITQLNQKEIEKPVIQLLYFTDPVCSTCWLVQPQLRKLSLRYSKYFEIKYHMGGLLPSWQGYNSGKIKNPNDAAEHWKEMAEKYNMPISPNVWLESPLSSSFPPSIAIKAAQLQNKIKAFHFHRRIKELLFFESKNITDIDLLIETAMEVGLDRERLIDDIGKMALVKFEEDLEYAIELNVRVLPTFIFSNQQNESIILSGYQEFETLENAILNLYPAAKKDKTIRKPLELFQIYQSMTTHEFTYLMDLEKKEAEDILINLSHSGLLQSKKNQSGSIWKLSRGV